MTRESNGAMNVNERNPLVSILVPTYDSARFLAAGVRGLGTNLVLSDDSSSDETVQLSQQLAAGNPKLGGW